MNRTVAKPIGDLGKIHLVISDHLPGCFYFHLDKIIDGAAVVKFTEHTGKLGAANQIISADILKCQRFVEMFFHVAFDADAGFLPGIQAVQRGSCGIGHQKSQ